MGAGSLPAGRVGPYRSRLDYRHAARPLQELPRQIRAPVTCAGRAAARRPAGVPRGV